MIKKIQNISFEEKLRLLYKLQLIDSYIDKLRNIKNNSITDIYDFNQDIKHDYKKLQNIKDEIVVIENIIKDNKNLAKNLNEKIIFYKQKINKHENNELKKKIEYKELEILFINKLIQDKKKKIKIKKNKLDIIKKNYNNKKKYLKFKINKLKIKISDNKKKEKIYIKKLQNIKKKVDSNLLNIYSKIRKNVKDGLAVVPVTRGASKGSYLFIPPQIHSELIQRKRIILDEHSGRILIDANLAEEVELEIK